MELRWLSYEEKPDINSSFCIPTESVRRRKLQFRETPREGFRWYGDPPEWQDVPEVHEDEEKE
jgi:hypothetical protein